MKTSEFKKLIREEVKKAMTNNGLNEASLPSSVKGQLDGLIKETIIPALFEDMALTPEGFQLAIKHLIKGLESQAAKQMNMGN
jgi:hypothetical protein